LTGGIDCGTNEEDMGTLGRLGKKPRFDSEITNQSG
jgi:hypothetical protein